jgi:alkylglycerol monooxygenase
VDCGYYWFHRASHEVGVLWAVHQVHHSSQEFNLTTAFRQPLLQGLFQLTHWFYLPAALIIPPSQFLVHSQFVFLFQFWIHSELVGDLGPLGLLLNTSTYHQVHHGANRYCLDKNYGGFLSIWDRIFGTFQDLRTDQEIVYGLIDQPKFFDVIYHQLFYFPSLQDKVAESNNWWDSLAVWIKGPGWFPGLPRLGNNELCPEVPQREKHYADIPLLTHLYLVLQLFGVFIIHDDLTKMFSTVSQPVSLGVMAFLFWTLTNIGLYYDNNSKALPSEIGRCVTALALHQPVLSLSPSVFTAWTVSSLGTALALNFYTPERRKTE